MKESKKTFFIRINEEQKDILIKSLEDFYFSNQEVWQGYKQHLSLELITTLDPEKGLKLKDN